MAQSVSALVDLATVKSELGIALSNTTDDAKLERYIDAVTGRIEDYCNRSFYHVSSQADSLGGMGSFYLLVTRPPLNSIASIAFDGSTLNSDSYEIDDSVGGVVRGVSAFLWTAGTLQNVTTTPLPGTERKLYVVTYDGGYITAGQSKAKGTLTFTDQPSASETFVLNNTTVTAVSGTPVSNEYQIGTNLSDTLNNLVTALLAGSESTNLSRAERIGSTVVITWGEEGTAGNSIVFTESIANATADGSGTLGGTQAGVAKTLPDAVEDAAVMLTVKRYRRKGKDPGVKSNKLLSHAVTYAGPSTRDSEYGIPTEIAQQLNPYVLFGQA
jgi:hypothetical protein